MSCFDDLYWGKGWIWDDEPDPDEMYISPLSVNGNAITVEVMPGRNARQTGTGQDCSGNVICDCQEYGNNLRKGLSCYRFGHPPARETGKTW